MIAGYKPNPALGAPIDEKLRKPSAAGTKEQNSVAQQVFNQVSQFPDIAYSEKDSLWLKTPPALQGPTLSKPPNGGFSKTGPPALIVGTPEAMANSFLVYPTYFEGENPRVSVGPNTLENAITEDFSVFRTPAKNDPSNVFSIAREKRQAAATEATRTQFYTSLNQELDDAVYGTSNAVVYAPQSQMQSQLQTQIQTQVQTVPIPTQTVAVLPTPTTTTFAVKQGGPERALVATRPTTAPLPQTSTYISNANGTSSLAEKPTTTTRNISAYIWDNRGWVAIVVLAALIIILLGVLIAKAVEADKYRKKYFDVLMVR